jgi:hypothetical protein
MQKNKYTVEVVDPCLEIDEYLPLQEKGWALQKWGWIFIISIMVAGALGLFGGGILSKQSISSGNSKGEYERFWRYEVEMKVLIESKDHIASISFPEQYLKKFRIVRFVPEPENNNTINNAVRYNFLPSENHTVSIYMISKDYGPIKGPLTVNERDNLNINHFIYP